jgi:tetratricopeptide (TPR) repeat protein
MSSRYATELNNMAWDFYEVAKTNDQLENALTWSKRSMEIHKELVQKDKENAGYLDTYAHLLYKLKRYDEAVVWQQKALDEEKENGTNPQKFEIELDKMKNRRF